MERVKVRYNILFFLRIFEVIYWIMIFMKKCYFFKYYINSGLVIVDLIVIEKN